MLLLFFFSNTSINDAIWFQICPVGHHASFKGISVSHCPILSQWSVCGIGGLCGSGGSYGIISCLVDKALTFDICD